MEFFLYYSLPSYASKNANERASVYTYSTGPSPSVNYSHGEKHKELGWHNAVFFGVVGRKEVLQVIKYSLAAGVGVPEDVKNSVVVDESKRSQIYCDDSPDYISFDRMSRVFCHLADGRVWIRHEGEVWFTDAE